MNPPKKDTGWEDKFDLLMQDCRVVHVFETEQFKKIKEFMGERIQAAYERGIKNCGDVQYLRGKREEREQAMKALTSLSVRNKDATCQKHRKPRGITANDYDCSDLHTGYEECLSDVGITFSNDGDEKDV